MLASGDAMSDGKTEAITADFFSDELNRLCSDLFRDLGIRGWTGSFVDVKERRPQGKRTSMSRAQVQQALKRLPRTVRR